MSDRTHDHEFETPVEPPARVRGRSGWRTLLTGVFALGLAFAAGLGATLAYDTLFELRGGESAQPPRSHVPVDSTEVAVEAPATGVDPLVLAMNMAAPDMGAHAHYDVQPTMRDGVVYLSGSANSRRTVARITEAVGRVPGVQAVDSRGVDIVGREHVFQHGERLSDLARVYYGNKRLWFHIADANPDLNPNLIRAGTEIHIPPLE